MWKKFMGTAFALVLCLIVISPVGGARFEDLNVTKLRIAGTEITATAAQLNRMGSTQTRTIPLPVLGFAIQSTGGLTLLGTTTTATPAHVVLSTGIPVIKLSNGYTSPVVINFRVPDDYSSGGAFSLMANQSGTTTPCTVDFDVYLNSSGSTMDSTATNQTPVTLAYAGTTPSAVTLTPATDFASLTAGQWVLLRIWRGATTGTDALQVGNVTFSYSATR